MTSGPACNVEMTRQAVQSAAWFPKAKAPTSFQRLHRHCTPADIVYTSCLQQRERSLGAGMAADQDMHAKFMRAALEQASSIDFLICAFGVTGGCAMEPYWRFLYAAGTMRAGASGDPHWVSRTLRCDLC